MSKINVIAHRGANKYAPQNTIPAFERAVQLGADGFETDVHLTKDSVPVICHNHTINETSNGMGSIASYTFDELRKLDFGSYYAPQFKGTLIPSLDEFLELSKQADIEVMNIELKGPKNKKTDVVPVIIDAVKRHNLSDRLVLSGFDSYLLKAAKDYDSSVRTAYLYGMPHCDNYRNMLFPILHAKKIGCYALHPMSIFVNKDYVKAAHHEGIKVNVWTVNSEDRIKYMIKCGVDGIITDAPDRTLNIMRSMGIK